MGLISTNSKPDTCDHLPWIMDQNLRHPLEPRPRDARRTVNHTYHTYHTFTGHVILDVLPMAILIIQYKTLENNGR